MCCGVTKDVGGVGAIIRFAVIEKFKRNLDLEDICGSGVHARLWESSGEVRFPGKQL